MELIEFATILSVLGVVSGTIIFVVLRFFPRKTTKKVAEDSINRLLRANNELTEQYEERQKKMFKSLQAENIKLRQELAPVDEDGEPVKPEVPWEVIQAGAQQMGISPIILLPFKKQILQATKGMSIEEIQQLASQGKGALGGVLGGGQTQQSGEGEFGTFSKELR